MEFDYRPKSKLEKFGNKIYSLLVENFSQTFYVGGMVRDLLLHIKVSDIDIATRARPDQVARVLKENGILYNDNSKNFGVVTAMQGGLKIEITTFRKDLTSSGRYPKVAFVNGPKQDSKRRDFSINALYLNGISKQILDFNGGTKDLKSKTIKFIGRPEKRIKEDPLRILRAIRFALILNLKFSKKTKTAIINNFSATDSLNKTRINRETDKILSQKMKKIFTCLLNDKKSLDKHFK